MTDQLCIRELWLDYFRSYAQINIQTSASFVILHGDNGVGKTSILEAISLLAGTKGLRKASLFDYQHQGGQHLTKTWAVGGSLQHGPSSYLLGVGSDPLFEKKITKIDGQIQKNQKLLKTLIYALWLVPSMDRFYWEGPSYRRQVLDDLIITQNDHYEKLLHAYKYQQDERLRLLKDAYSRGQAPDSLWLDELENKMLHYGISLTMERLLYVQKMNKIAPTWAGLFPSLEVRLQGDLIPEQGKDFIQSQQEEFFRQALYRNRAEDGLKGRTHTSAQHDDMLLWHQDHQRLGQHCSSGEQKALLISLLLSAADLATQVKGFKPLLLLDDVAVHLDEKRRNALPEILTHLGAQAWLTGTDQSFFQSFHQDSQIFHLKKAK